MLTLCAPLCEVKMDASQPGRFKGYGSTFGNVDLGKDVCVKGCFGKSLEAHAKTSTLPALCWMHDRSEPIGDWIEMREDARGLVVEGQLWTGDAETEASRKACNMMRGTGPKGLSIGYAAKRWSYDEKKQVRSLEEVDLFEVSVVGYGMNPKAIVTMMKSLMTDDAAPSEAHLLRALTDAGMTEHQAKALLAGGFARLAATYDPPKDAAADMRDLLRLRAILRGESHDD